MTTTPPQRPTSGSAAQIRGSEARRRLLARADDLPALDCPGFPLGEFDTNQPETSLENPAGETPLAQQKVGSSNPWEIRNGGSGRVHPFHVHMEDHSTVMRDGCDVSARNGSPGHPDEYSREDLVALDPGESVIVYRGLRNFTGQYVAHCHNLAHEDHALGSSWEITP